jgi:iron(III) transport system permease protein
MRGAIFVHALAAIPWVALVVGIGLAQIDPAQEEAALLVLPPSRVLLGITLPQALPFVVAAALFTVVGTTSEMTVTNIFLINTKEQTITEQFYMMFSLQLDASEATVGVLPGLAGLGIVVTLTLWIVAQAIQRPTWFAAGPPLTFASGPWRPVLATLLWLVIGVIVAVPMASLITKAGFVVVHEHGQRMQSWSALKCLTEVARAPRQFGLEFRWTIETAVGAATIALLAAVGLGWPARNDGWRATPALVSTALAMATPGPLVAVALIWVFNRSLWPGLFNPLVELYDHTPVVVMIAQAIHALPLTTLVAWNSFRTLDRDVLAAAAIDGASPWQVLWRIALPQRWRALVAAWLAAFAIAAGDIAWAQLIRPAGMDLIQRRVFGLVHSGVEEQVAAISLVNVFAYALLAALILWLLRPRPTYT